MTTLLSRITSAAGEIPAQAPEERLRQKLEEMRATAEEASSSSVNFWGRA